jgi:hypothetical protein
MSFDLGVQGDYQGLYTWLDSHGAKECGDSTAYLFYEHSGELVRNITDDLRSSVAIDPKKSRVYIVKTVAGKTEGKFIFGGRRRPPWEGFAVTGEQSTDRG